MLGHSPLSGSPISTLPGAAGPTAYTLVAASGSYVVSGTAAVGNRAYKA